MPAEQLDAAVERLVESILASGPRAVRLQKALITAWEDLPLRQAVQRGIDSFAAAWESDEPRRMMQDFLEREARRVSLLAGRTERPRMSEEAITGAEWLARTLAANGTTHVFFIDAVLRRTLIELGALGVTRVLAHAEKSAAYMADGYARIAGTAGHLLRAVGRRGEPRGGAAGCVSRPQPGDRADRARAAALPASQHLSGTPAPAALRVGDEVLGRCRPTPPTCRGCCARPGARR